MPGKTLNPTKSIELYSKLKSKGFSEKEKPEEREPRMPNNIGSMSSKEIGDLEGKYAAWREYASDSIILLAAKIAEMRATFTYEYAKTYAQMPSKGQNGEKITETLKKELIEADPHIYDMRKSIMEVEIYYDMLSAKVDSYNDALTVISREIARRGQDFDTKPGPMKRGI